MIQAIEASAIEAGCRGDSVGMTIVNALKRIGRYDLLSPCERESEDEKCPYQTKVIHKPESTLTHAEDITEFCECIESECPFYYTIWAHKDIPQCRRVESEGKWMN